MTFFTNPHFPKYSKTYLIESNEFIYFYGVIRCSMVLKYLSHCLEQWLHISVYLRNVRTTDSQFWLSVFSFFFRKRIYWKAPFLWNKRGPTNVKILVCFFFFLQWNYLAVAINLRIKVCFAVIFPSVRETWSWWAFLFSSWTITK